MWMHSVFEYVSEIGDVSDKCEYGGNNGERFFHIRYFIINLQFLAFVIEVKSDTMFFVTKGNTEGWLSG